MSKYALLGELEGWYRSSRPPLTLIKQGYQGVWFPVSTFSPEIGYEAAQAIVDQLNAEDTNNEG